MQAESTMLAARQVGLNMLARSTIQAGSTLLVRSAMQVVLTAGWVSPAGWSTIIAGSAMQGVLTAG
jgi:hypothetical protein